MFLIPCKGNTGVLHISDPARPGTEQKNQLKSWERPELQGAPGNGAAFVTLPTSPAGRGDLCQQKKALVQPKNCQQTFHGALGAFRVMQTAAMITQHHLSLF